MYTQVHVFRHDTPDREVFVTDLPARINIPTCLKGLKDHLDVEIQGFSIHIPLEDLRKLINNVVQIRSIKKGNNVITLKENCNA